MKKIIYSLALALGLCACGKKSAQTEAPAEEAVNDHAVLVAYFSATGTTARVAKMMAESIQADLLEIVPAEPYTEADLDWHNPESRSSVEMKDTTARPALGFEIPDLSRYKLIYLGYPIWWGVAPRIINTFIEKAEIADSVQLLPFATSGGSPLEPSAEALKATYPNLRWEEGILLNNIDDNGYHVADEDSASTAE